MLQIRSKVYRGKPGFSIHGTDPRGRSVRIFAESRVAAERIREKVKRGEEVNVEDFKLSDA